MMTDGMPATKNNIGDYRLPGLISACPLGWFILLISALTIIVYRHYLFFEDLFLFKDVGSDTVLFFYPRLVLIADYLRTDGIPGWSFNSGMGQNIFPNSLGNLFNLLLYAIGSERLAYGIGYVEAFKVIVGGIVFFLYLRLVSSNYFVCLVGGLLYAFSGYMVLGGTWYIFSTEAVFLAVLLYAFELYLQKKLLWPLPLAVALIASSFTVDLYTHALFMVCYGVIRYQDTFGWHPRKIAVFFLKLIGLGLIGCGMAAVFLVANVGEIFQSDRVSGIASMTSVLQGQPVLSMADGHALVTAIMRTFSSNMLGIGSNYHGVNNYLEDPNFYCGLVSLLLAPQLFVFLDNRQRVRYGLLAAILVLPVIFPYFRYAFWLFSGDYFRVYSLFVSLVLLLFALRALGNIIESGQLNTRLLVITLAILLCGLLFPYGNPDQFTHFAEHTALVWMSAGLLCLYALLIVGMHSGKYRSAASVLLLVAVCAELVLNASMTVNDRPVISGKEFSGHTGYNDESVEAIAYLKKNDQGFYRIEKDYSSFKSTNIFNTTLNDGMVQGYRGTSTYQSFNITSYLEFLSEMDLVSEFDNKKGRRWILGLRDRPILLSFASVKYLLSRKPISSSYQGFQTIGHVGGVRVEKNLFALPFGFTYDSYIPLSKFSRLATGQKDIALIKGVVLDDLTAQRETGYLRQVSTDAISNDFDPKEFEADVEARRNEAMQIDSFSQNDIAGRISLKQARLLFFSIPYDTGWHVDIDGMPAELVRVNVGFTGLLVPPGSHGIRLVYQPAYWRTGWACSIGFTILLLLLSWESKLMLFIGKRKPGSS